MLQLCMEMCGLTLRSGVRERSSGKKAPEGTHEGVGNAWPPNPLPVSH